MLRAKKNGFQRYLRIKRVKKASIWVTLWDFEAHPMKNACHSERSEESGLFCHCAERSDAAISYFFNRGMFFCQTPFCALAARFRRFRFVT